jgi:hypothetical protein
MSEDFNVNVRLDSSFQNILSAARNTQSSYLSSVGQNINVPQMQNINIVEIGKTFIEVKNGISNLNKHLAVAAASIYAFAKATAFFSESLAGISGQGRIPIISGQVDTMMETRMKQNGTAANVDRAVAEENARVQILALQNEYLERQNALVNAGKEGMLAANREGQEWTRELKTNLQLNENILADTLNTIQQKYDDLRNQNETMGSQIETMTRREGWFETGPKAQNTADGMSMKSFNLTDGSTVQVSRAKILGDIQPYGRIVWNGQTYHFADQKQYQEQIKNIVEKLNQGIKSNELAEIQTAQDIKIESDDRSQISAKEKQVQIQNKIEQENLLRSIASREKAFANEAGDVRNGIDARNYAIRKTQNAEIYAAEMKYQRTLAAERDKAAKEVREIDVRETEEAARQMGREIDFANESARLKSDINTSLSTGYGIMTGATAEMAGQGQHSITEAVRHANALLKIEEDYRTKSQAAGSVFNREQLSMQRGYDIEDEKRRHDAAKASIASADEMGMSRNLINRNMEERAIQTETDLVNQINTAVSTHRKNLVTGMLQGNLNFMDAYVSMLQRNHDIAMSNAKSEFDLKVQYQRELENIEKQRIDDVFEQTTARDRQTIASLSRKVEDGTATQADRVALQNAQNNITAAERRRRMDIEAFMRNPRSSVSMESVFNRQMNIEQNRHKEQISYLSAIASNTGKIVNSISDDYRRQVERSWTQSMPGLGAFWAQRTVSNYNQDNGMTTVIAQTIVPIMKDMLQNTNGLRSLPAIAAQPARMA